MHEMDNFNIYIYTHTHISFAQGHYFVTVLWRFR